MNSMNVQSKLRYLRTSPRKVREVARVVMGKQIQTALDLLTHLKRKSSKDIYKLIKSAAANAYQKGLINTQQLYVHTIKVDQGPTHKRSLPRARGTATPILKRTSHVTVVLQQKGN